MNVAPPILPRNSTRNTWYALVILAVATLGTAAVLYGFNPAIYQFYPVCRFHQLTGLNCPGCGATRAAYALLHGHLAVALRDNALLTLAPIALLGRAGWMVVGHWRQRPVAALIPVHVIWVLGVLALVFTILRNLPAFAFLSPA